MNWKEAATLLLVRPLAKNLAKRVIPAQPKVNTAVTTQLQRLQESHDYEIYVGVRSAKLKFFASSLAFPGGAFEPEDGDAGKWSEILKQPHPCTAVPSSCLFVRLPLYERHRVSEKVLDPRVAFRICAIRELAEETGMILSYKSPSMPINDVLHKPATFADTLLEMGRLPAINLLYDWRCWLTPKAIGGSQRKTHRFDTIFYIAFIDNESEQITSQSKETDEEMGELRWSTVPELVHSFLGGSINLPPPQLHELSTLLRYPKFNELKRFVTQDMVHDKLERWLPIRAQFAGENAPMTTIMPGDSLYPSSPALALESDSLEISDTFEESCRKSKHIHRVFWGSDESGKPNPRLLCNFDTFNTGQLAPINDLDLGKLHSHL